MFVVVFSVFMHASAWNLSLLQLHPELSAVPEQYDSGGLHDGAGCSVPVGDWWPPRPQITVPRRLPGNRRKMQVGAETSRQGEEWCRLLSANIWSGWFNVSAEKSSSRSNPKCKGLQTVNPFVFLRINERFEGWIQSVTATHTQLLWIPDSFDAPANQLIISGF